MPDVTIRCTIEGDRVELSAFGFVGDDHGPITFHDARSYLPTPGALARVFAEVIWHLHGGGQALLVEQRLIEDVTELW